MFALWSWKSQLGKCLALDLGMETREQPVDRSLEPSRPVLFTVADGRGEKRAGINEVPELGDLSQSDFENLFFFDIIVVDGRQKCPS